MLGNCRKKPTGGGRESMCTLGSTERRRKLSTVFFDMAEHQVALIWRLCIQVATRHTHQHPERCNELQCRLCRNPEAKLQQPVQNQPQLGLRNQVRIAEGHPILLSEVLQHHRMPDLGRPPPLTGHASVGRAQGGHNPLAMTFGPRHCEHNLG